jgi:hypothetical protein
MLLPNCQAMRTARSLANTEILPSRWDNANPRYGSAEVICRIPDEGLEILDFVQVPPAIPTTSREPLAWAVVGVKEAPAASAIQCGCVGARRCCRHRPSGEYSSWPHISRSCAASAVGPQCLTWSLSVAAPGHHLWGDPDRLAGGQGAEGWELGREAVCVCACVCVRARSHA